MNSAKNISINQNSVIKDTLRKFHMQDSHPVRNPLVKNMDYSRLLKNETNFPYKSALGHLMWLAHLTRPDIAFATNFLARFQRSFTEDKWIMIK